MFVSGKISNANSILLDSPGEGRVGGGSGMKSVVAQLFVAAGVFLVLGVTPGDAACNPPDGCYLEDTCRAFGNNIRCKVVCDNGSDGRCFKDARPYCFQFRKCERSILRRKG